MLQRFTLQPAWILLPGFIALLLNLYGVSLKDLPQLLNGNNESQATSAVVRATPRAFKADLETDTILDQILRQGYLDIVAPSGPTTYYTGLEGTTGFEYQLLNLFANYMGVELRVHEADSKQSILQTMQSSGFHLGVSNTTFQETESAGISQFHNEIDFFPTEFLISAQLIQHRHQPKLKNLADHAGKRVVIGNNSQHLSLLQSQLVELEIQVIADASVSDLLAMVENGETQFALIDSHEYRLGRPLHPMTEVAKEIGTPRSLSWAFIKPIEDDSLETVLSAFFADIQYDGTMEQLQERFYGHMDDWHPVDAQTFLANVNKRLPKYQELFESYAKQNDLDWQLLAAMAYQESHFNPKAVSRTGVRGIMMLTRVTAREMGIKNRLDPEQSIDGGARYFKRLKQRLPTDIQEPDRTWFTLSAYNVGLGHVNDARRITASQGDDPNEWQAVKERLPLLQKAAYYRKTRYGYARGMESATYVERIRRFYDLLHWRTFWADQQLARNLVVNDADTL